MNVGKLLETVNSLAPLNSAFEDDFVGITIGSEDAEVNGLVVAHEIEPVSYTHLTLPTICSV